MSECVLFEPDICEKWRSQEESVMCFPDDSVIIAERSAEYETDGLEQHRAGWTIWADSAHTSLSIFLEG